MSIWKCKCSLKLGKIIETNIVYYYIYAWREDDAPCQASLETCHLRGFLPLSQILKDDIYTFGGPKSPYGLFCKIKDTCFVFTNNFTDLDILSMLAISCIV